MTAADPITLLNAALEGRYEIERELSEGGVATVFVGRVVFPNWRPQIPIAVSDQEKPHGRPATR